MTTPIRVEIENIFTKLVQYFENQFNYLNSGGTPPNTSDIEALVYSESQSLVRNQAQAGSSYIIGAAQEAVFSLAAIQRELNMSSPSKADLYNAHMAELTEEVDFHASSGNFYSGVVGGAPTTGSRS